ncbi:hypothetical protein [Cognatilysobacter segetis]|uniref:hypothetical protein n=1 Tax=Cognatilysobacter segetis TaxID=2492394 RepID=UPI00105E24A1|nr:hypothetical protein [Lysobacter segetis]
MTRTALSALVLLGLATALHAADTPPKKLYCWNEGGRKVCGDALPSSAVDAARTEINSKSGMATSALGRALTPEERAAADARARAEADAATASAAEQRRLMAMVETFPTEGDLRRAFEARVSLNRDAMQTARMGIDGLRQSLVLLLRRAGDAELLSKPVPKPLASDIRNQHGQLLAQQAALATLQREAATIQSQLQEAVTRYRELKPQPAGAATAPAPTPAG